MLPEERFDRTLADPGPQLSHGLAEPAVERLLRRARLCLDHSRVGVALLRHPAHSGQVEVLGVKERAGEDRREWAAHRASRAHGRGLDRRGGMRHERTGAAERRDVAAKRAPCIKHGRSLLTAIRCYYRLPPKSRPRSANLRPWALP